MYRRYVSRVIALAGVIGFLTLSAPPSWGAPSDSGTSADSTTLSLADVGSAPMLEFWGVTSSQQLTVPVLHGLVPSTFNATVELPINLRSGTMTVTQDQRSLARLNLPATDQTPIVIPLAGAEVHDNWLTVTLRTYLAPQENQCLYPWSPLRLLNGTITYTGAEQAPTTVAHFLPPVLHKLTIFVPPSPSTAESDTAIQLATSAAEHYGRQVPEITVNPLPEGQSGPPTGPGPLERQIVVKEGPDSGLILQGSPNAPWLLISGPLNRADETDIAVLFSDLSQLALAPKASAEALKPIVHFPGNSTTIRDLGQPFANATSLQPRVSIGLDQTRFGRSIHSVRVHLQGSYTPTPPNVGGQVEVLVGEETIDHWPTDGGGTIDRWVDVPDRLLQRYTNVDVLLDVAANIGHCGDFYTAGNGNQMLTLKINGDTTIQSGPAAPPVPDGMQSMPQALMPRVQVGIEPHSFGDTWRAAQIMVGLQRISPIPIETTVTTVQQAIDSSNPAVVISPDGWNHGEVVLPVSAGSSGPITVNAFSSGGKPTRITLDPAMHFASLQTVFTRNRSLLVATSNGASIQLDELLRWLNSDNKHWQRLKGVAVVAAPGQDPVTVEHAPVIGAAQAAAAGTHSDNGWLWWFGAAWLGVAVLGGGVILFRSRRLLRIRRKS
ncbi:hypothetical protein MRAB57_3113 [Mycobacterium rhizamassiliense]|uniref:Uncharacterized protein n=2 Tax=Mycobacterium rhizamassiliense TaxID=1841860 RepID=A0A2U3NUV1_9MYCO|nr:hypothetical protein MRAB57_3113 [Mycobacterium rhizamassiliense]